MKKQKILALDFDGCIVDSVKEALFVTYASYRKFINKETKIFDNKNPEINNFLNLISDYQSQVQEFKQYRHYIKDASDYAAILYIMENNLKVSCDDEFFKIKELIPEENLKKYYECFYNTRAKMIKNNFDAWAKLTPGFNCIDKIRELTNKYKAVIATTNSKESIKDLLGEAYLNLNVKENDIIDLHISTDKIIQTGHIAKIYKVKFDNIHFVDDNLSHLLAVQGLGVNVYLAGWGYCTEEQKDSAEKREDITLLTEENIYLVLDEALG